MITITNSNGNNDSQIFTFPGSQYHNAEMLADSLSYYHILISWSRILSSSVMSFS